MASWCLQGRSILTFGEEVSLYGRKLTGLTKGLERTGYYLSFLAIGGLLPDLS